MSSHSDVSTGGSTVTVTTSQPAEGCEQILCDGEHNSHESAGCCLPYYCACFAGEEGAASQEDCPTGMVFNSVVGHCTSPANDACCANQTSSTPITMSSQSDVSTTGGSTMSTTSEPAE